MEEKVIIYTDGACSGNPGPGGWGAILMYKDTKKEISGGKKDTTNNVMELTAALEALKLLKFPCEVELYSDSAYLVNGFNQGWIYGWQKNNWKKALFANLWRMNAFFLVALKKLILYLMIFLRRKS